MVVEAVVLELPVRERRPTHPCGCYVAAIPRKGRAVWRRWPQANGGLLACHEDDAAWMVEQNRFKFDGVDVEAAYDDSLNKSEDDPTFCRHYVRIYHGEGGWPVQHPTSAHYIDHRWGKTGQG